MFVIKDKATAPGRAKALVGLDEDISYSTWRRGMAGGIEQQPRGTPFMLSKAK